MRIKVVFKRICSREEIRLWYVRMLLSRIYLRHLIIGKANSPIIQKFQLFCVIRLFEDYLDNLKWFHKHISAVCSVTFSRLLVSSGQHLVYRSSLPSQLSKLPLLSASYVVCCCDAVIGCGPLVAGVAVACTYYKLVAGNKKKRILKKLQ